MITAKEAKEISDMSDLKVQNLIKSNIEYQIRKAAEAGLCKVFIFCQNEPTYMNIKATAFEKRVMMELTKLGFMAQFGRDGAPYVPPGLANDLGEGPQHQNCGYHISW
jgi:hypothetical protein